jgi:hypothetical protein
MPELKPYKGIEGVYLWHYVPSKAASIVFMISFAIGTIIIIARMIKTRTWFSIPFVIGAILETLGFAARASCTDRTDELGPYAIQFLLILIAPALFAASIYMALSRLMRTLHAESYSIISARWMTIIFVFGDVLSFLVQIGGGSMAANPDANKQAAKWIILIGLLVQIIFFAIFLVTAVIFHRRMSHYPQAAGGNVNWIASMTMLYTVSGLIMVRSIFRVIEYVMGFDSYLFKKEWPIYVFDAVLMLLAVLIWSYWYPGNLRVEGKTKAGVQEEVPMYVRMEDGHAGVPRQNQH